MPKAKPLTLVELSELFPRLQATVKALLGADRNARAQMPHASRTARKTTASTRTRAGAADLQDRLLETLKGSKQGFGLGEIVKKVGAPEGPVSYHLRQLRAKKKVRVVGTRQFARWLASK